ncbi:unnamed protein product [Effrenium voratum]|nr:unnamed protein product [Effrenium voratum]
MTDPTQHAAECEPGFSCSQSVQKATLFSQAPQRQQDVSPACSIPKPTRQAQDREPGVPGSQAAQEPFLQNQAHPRFFLDLCSGSSVPLSRAMMEAGKCVLHCDIPLDAATNAVNDAVFSSLERLCSAGVVGYLAVKTNGRERSLLQLPALKQMVHLLYLAGGAGGQGHLEQPANAVSWEEDVVQTWLRRAGATCISVPACSVGLDGNHSWLFAGTHASFDALAFSSDYSPEPHPETSTIRLADSSTPSERTAEYPLELARRFAAIVAPMCSGPAKQLTLQEALSWIPIKRIHEPPWALHDGAGGNPDWSAPQNDNYLQALRHTWVKLVLDGGLHKKLMAHLQQHSAEPPFSEADLAPFKTALINFLSLQDTDWAIPQWQPFRLHILDRLCSLLRHPDKAVMPALFEGVPSGFHHNIPHSTIFPARDTTIVADTNLSVHFSNWSNAEANADLVSDLIQQEMAEGWVYRFDGDLTQAQQCFPAGVAIGKLNVVTAPGRKPRLILDSTICGTNQRCLIPDRCAVPSPKDVLRVFPLRENAEELWGFSLDIQAAHKRIRLLPAEQGLFGFRHQGHLYFYRVTPFGATPSAHWWARAGALLLRIFQDLVFWKHASLLYVDDFLFMMCKRVLPLSATMIVILALLLGCPISWPKCELGPQVIWVGWSFHFSSGYVALTEEKRLKLLEQITSLLTHRHVSRKALEQFIGLFLWVTNLFPLMRPWVYFLYKDLHSPIATQYSLNPDQWLRFCSILNDDLTISETLPGTSFRVGSRVLSVRHKQLRRKADLRDVRITDKRIWVRVSDPTSSRRKLHEDSIHALQMWRTWASSMPPVLSLYPPRWWSITAAADACAKGNDIGVGGFLQDANGKVLWFSELFHPEDFTVLGISMSSDAQKDISSYETFAQMGLLHVAASKAPNCRLCCVLPTVTDNTSVEAGVNKFFSSKYPLCRFLQQLCLMATRSAIRLDTTHIPGEHNIEADALSRLHENFPKPERMQDPNRVRFTLQDLWQVCPTCEVLPKGTRLGWDLPSSQLQGGM